MSRYIFLLLGILFVYFTGVPESHLLQLKSSDSCSVSQESCSCSTEASSCCCSSQDALIEESSSLSWSRAGCGISSDAPGGIVLFLNPFCISPLFDVEIPFYAEKKYGYDDSKLDLGVLLLLEKPPRLV